MSTGKTSSEQKGLRFLALFVSAMMIVQLSGLHNMAHASSTNYFRGFNQENIVTGSGGTFVLENMQWSGSVLSMKNTSDGTAYGELPLDDTGHDISASVDLGGLEIDFSALAKAAAEEGGVDVPSARVSFLNGSDQIISAVNLHVSGSFSSTLSETLTSGASIPANTRMITVELFAANAVPGSTNTVTFENVSLIIHDAAPPTCSASFNDNWTNQDVTVTVLASDDDSGLAGIYVNDVLKSTTSPYTFTVSANASYSAYSKDYAGKTSGVQTVNVTKIDKSVPAAPASVTLSASDWTNADVLATVPALGTSSGSPERTVYRFGTSGAWTDFPGGGLTVTDSGVYSLNVAVADDAGNQSSALTKQIKIDKNAPVIGDIEETVSSGQCDVTLSITDPGASASGIKVKKYASGTQDASYFLTGGTVISGGAFSLSIGGVYTIWAQDNAGNTALQTYEFNTAPSIIKPVNLTINEDETREIALNVTDETAYENLVVKADSDNTALIPVVNVIKGEDGIKLSITPAANKYGGPVKITVSVTDAANETTTDSFSVTVLPVNDPPVAVDDTATVNEDESVRIDALANDYDIIDVGDILSLKSVDDPPHGTASIVAGKIKYVPDPDFNGTDSFDYTLTDDKGGTDRATVTVTVAPVNDAPVASDDAVTTKEDTDVLVNVLANDRDADAGDTLSITSIDSLVGGTAAVEDGKIRFTPSPNFYGQASFRYSIEDTSHAGSSAKVTVTVTPVDDAPAYSGVDAEYTTNEDVKDYAVSFSITDQETPANSLMLQAVSNKENILPSRNIKIEGLGDNNPGVTIKMTPLPNKYDESGVTITLSLGDGFNTVTKTFLLKIMSVDDAPVAASDEVTYDEGEPSVTIQASTLLANDTDIDSSTLTVTGVAPGGEPAHGTLETQYASEGGPVSAFVYTPEEDYSGQASFTYVLSDGELTDEGVCTLVINAQNQAPSLTGLASSYSMDEDTTKSDITFSIADRETTDASKLLVTAWSGSVNLVNKDGILVTNSGDGTCSLSLSPVGDANGSAKIWVSVSDGNSATKVSFDLTVNPVQDKPVAVADYVYVPLSGSQTFSVLANDYDVDGDELSVSSWDDSGLLGKLTYDSASKLFTYTAKDGEEGEKTFTYVLTDGTEPVTGTVTLNITDQGYPPELGRIANQYVNEDGTVSVSFTVTDRDLGDTITVDSPTSLDIELLPQDEEHMAVSGSSGTYTLTLKPASDRFGTVTVIITVRDAKDNTDSVSFTLTVLPVNDAPTANPDTQEILEDHSAVLTPLANDTDVEGDTIWIKSVSSPAHGVLDFNAGTYTYTPYGDWNGAETLTYTVTDGQATATSTITITVDPVNDAPVAHDRWLVVPITESVSRTVNVMSGNYDPDGDSVSFVGIISQGTHGTAVYNGDGTVTYTRNETLEEGYSGADQFEYRISDGTLTSDAWVYVDDVFTSSLSSGSVYYTKYEDDPAFQVNLPISNPNNKDYTVSMDSSSMGTFTHNEGDPWTKWTFTPAPDANGYEAVKYTASGDGESDYAYVELRIYPVDDAPVIDQYNGTAVTPGVPTSESCAEDSLGVSFDINFHDVDTTDPNLTVYAYTDNTVSTSAAPLVVELTVTDHNDGTATVQAVPIIANSNGETDIIVGVSDGVSSVTHTVHLTVTPVDDAPFVENLSRTLYEDTSDTVALITPNTDVDGEGVTLSFKTLPLHGTVEDRGDGTATYTPNPDYNGPDSYEYTVTDDTGAAKASTATVSLTVEPVNDPPVISNLEYMQTTLEDTPKDVPLTVSDADGDTITYQFTSSNPGLVPVANLSIRQDTGDNMIITANPAANAYGVTVVTVTASDGIATATGAFRLTVTSVNDIPVASDVSVTIDEAVWPVKTTSTVIDLRDKYFDVEGTPQISAITDISVGKAVNNNGVVTYSVDGNFNGTATFKYTVLDSDGATATGTVTVNITPRNDPPVAQDDRNITTDENTPVTVHVLSNDTDAEGDTLSVVSATGGTGALAINGDNTVTYTPNGVFNGNDSFTYTISDGNGGTSTATVYLAVDAVNDPPVIAKYAPTLGDWTMLEDTTDSFHFVVSDEESAVNNLIITITSLDETKLKTAGILLSSGTDEGERILTVTPEQDATGVMPVKFSVTDGDKTTEVTYDITITPVNDPPVIGAQKITTPEETPVSSSVTATDVDSTTLTYSLAEGGEPTHGTAAVNPDGSFTYTPELDYCGADSFTVRVDDGDGGTADGVVSVTVTPVNDDPTAVDDAIGTAEDTPVVINVLGNDTDPDLVYGDFLTIVNNLSPAHGSVVIFKDTDTAWKVRYTPDQDWNGTDTFSYTIRDSEEKSSTAAITVTVGEVNDAPGVDVSGDDAAETMEGHSVDIAVTVNDDVDELTNPALEDVTVDAVTQAPANGSAVIDGTKKIITYMPTYTSAVHFNGTDTFQYRAIDRNGLTAVFTVTVTVDPVNDPPTIDALSDVTMDEEATQNVTVNVADMEDLDGDLTVTVTRDNSALFGPLTATAAAPGTDNGTFTLPLAPLKDKVGTVHVTVTVKDSGNLTAQATFTVTVNNVNDDPNAQDDAATVSEGGSVTIDVLANDDVDLNNGGDTLSITDFPATTPKGTLELVTENGMQKLKYTANPDTSATTVLHDTFAYTMRDAAGGTSGRNTANVTVTINPVNDAPTITPIQDLTGANKILEDNATGDIAFTVADEEDAPATLHVAFTSNNTTLFPTNRVTLTHGSLGQWTINALPAANKYGTGTITLTVTDSGTPSPVKSTSETFTVEVQSVNDDPVNGNDTITLNEDGTITVNVLQNDDVDYATQPQYDTVVSVTDPPHGTATLNPDYTVTYKPDHDYNGPDSFSYMMHDLQDDTYWNFDVAVTVNPVNDPPVIQFTDTMAPQGGYAVWYDVDEGGLQTDIPFTVTDPDNTNVSVTSVSSKTRLVPNGNITIHRGANVDNTESLTLDVQANGHWNGTTVITLTANDGAATGTAQFLFIVNSVNSVPVAVADTYHVNEDALTMLPLLSNDTDEDLETDDDEAIAIQDITYDTGDTRIKSLAATASGDGVNFQAAADFNGGPITFTYTIHDAHAAISDPVTVTVIVDQVNDAPVTQNDTVTTPEDQAANFDVLANDSDVDETPGLNASPDPALAIDRAGLAQPAHGTVVVTTDGGGKPVVRYTPVANFNGTDTFMYYAYDGKVKTLGTVSVTVSPVNDAPVAVNDSKTTAEDTFTTINVLANDTDVDKQAGLNAHPETETMRSSIDEAELKKPDHGYILHNPDDTIVYTPDANYYGTDTFEYYAVDAAGAKGRGTVTVTVTSVNDPPQFDAVPANLTFDEDGTDTTTFAVSDIETAEPALVVTVTGSSNTALIKTSDVTFGRDGGGNRTVTVKPEKDQNSGPVTLTLKVQDTDGGSATCTFNVTVNAVNDAPVAQDVTTSIDEDGSYSVAWGTITSDVDIATNGDSLSVTLKDGAGPASGTAEVAGGNILYTPEADWNGTVSFTYIVSDGELTDEGLITVTVRPVNDTPQPSADSDTTGEDTPVIVDVLGNDWDVDMDSGLNHAPGVTESLSISTANIVQPSHGSAAVVTDEGKQKIRYTPQADYNGPDSFTYTVTDQGGKTAQATVSLQVTQVNDNPVAKPDSASTDEDTTISVDVLANDTDVDLDANLNKDVLHDRDFSIGSIAFVGTAHGTIDKSGSEITFDPDKDFYGVQKISYELLDGYGGTATGVLTISVGSVDDPPDAVDDSVEIQEDGVARINVTANDEDDDLVTGDSLTLDSFVNAGSLPGTLDFEADGDVTFTPDANYYGTITVDYIVQDEAGAQDTGTLTITVDSVNDAPTAQDGTADVNEDDSVVIGVETLIDDVDLAGPDGDTLTVSVGTAGNPAHGEVSVSGDQITYTPDADWNGTDSFTYTVADRAGEKASAQITVTVAQVNDAPVAQGDAAQVNEDDSVDITVLSNDSDKDMLPGLNAHPEDEALSVAISTPPTHGTAEVNDNGVTYTPDADYNGPDSFVYELSDGEASAYATVDITVNQVNDAPVANDDVATTGDGDLVTIDVLGNDDDVDTDESLNAGTLHSKGDFRVTGVTTPANGTAVIHNNKVDYTAGDTFAGDDSFEYVMSDGHGGTASATVTVTVLSVNDPPATPVVTQPAEGTLYGGGSTVTVTWTGFDIDGDELTYALEYYDGSKWNPIEDGLTDTTYDFPLPDTLKSITDLQFRVNASDSEYTSDYGYSGKLILDKDAPANVMVTMTRADGKPYTAGTWTNQSVTVKAVSVDDLTHVTFKYALEDKAYVAASSQLVESGVHDVFIQATDALGNVSEFGGYLVKIDKQAPAVPKVKVSLSGAKALVSMTLYADPGGSGNSYVLAPDGSRLEASQSTLTWSADKNSVYAFTIYDNVGNATKFSATVDNLDETPPQIACDSGSYKTGDTSEKPITATLSFTDDMSQITAQGYAVTQDKTYGAGVYTPYKNAITIDQPGTYYIHAYAENAFALTAYGTFGPFIVAEPKSGTPVPGTVDVGGDTTVDPGDVSDGAKKIRLPGGQWQDTLDLKDIKPGTYLIEVLDKDGNTKTVEITITDQDIAAGKYQPASAPASGHASPARNMLPWIAWPAAGAGILLLLLLLLWRNVWVQACVTQRNGNEKVLRVVRRLRRSRDTLTVLLKSRHVSGSTYGRITLSKGLTRSLRKKTLAVELNGKTVMSVVVPENEKSRFTAEIKSWNR